jgi:hypothetical protein
VRARSDDEEPDWEREMSIFKERTMRPNQLATLRELESKVSVGKVRRGQLPGRCRPALGSAASALGDARIGL